MVGRANLPVARRCRVIVDNDWSGDPDGLLALAHHLLSRANHVAAITSSFLDPRFDSPVARAEDGAVLARELVELIDPQPPPVVHAGSDRPLGRGPIISPASEAIVAEARRPDPLPLYLVCGGPLTNVEAALRRAPDIAERLTLVWIGGTVDPSASEYNRDTDPTAADFVMTRRELTVWQFPLETYRRCTSSIAELEFLLTGSGRVGRWLWDRFRELPLPDWLEVGEVWPLGDSPPVLVTALSDESSAYVVVDGTEGAKGPSRVYTDVDVRLLLADLVAKLHLHEQHLDAAPPRDLARMQIKRRRRCLVCARTGFRRRRRRR